MSARQPELLVVVDTEEEFDWTKPFDRVATATRSIPAQERAQAIYDEMGLVPTYVCTYPVACDPVAVAYLKRLQDEGRAEIGAHLHPWVTPPHHEAVTAQNSYQCNLPPKLERTNSRNGDGSCAPAPSSRLPVSSSVVVSANSRRSAVTARRISSSSAGKGRIV